jgi:hypothetical protein
MRKIVVVAVVLVLLPIGGLLFGRDINDIYESICRMSVENTPATYRVKVENESFREALAELPDEIRTGKEEPAVMVYFKKGDGVKIVIENIKPEYASIFSMYEDYLKFSGISNIQNPDEFKKIIDMNMIKFHKEDSKSVVVKAWDPENGEMDDNFALFTLNKGKWVIESALYYLDGNPYVKAENRYRNYDSYYLPYEVVLKNLTDNSSEIFRFTDYRFE